MGYLTDGLTFRTLRDANVRRFAKFVSQFKRRGTMKNELILWLRATCIFVLAILIISAVTLIMLKYTFVFLIAITILVSICFIYLIKNEL